MLNHIGSNFCFLPRAFHLNLTNFHIFWKITIMTKKYRKLFTKCLEYFWKRNFLSENGLKLNLAEGLISSERLKNPPQKLRENQTKLQRTETRPKSIIYQTTTLCLCISICFRGHSILNGWYRQRTSGMVPCWRRSQTLTTLKVLSSVVEPMWTISMKIACQVRNLENLGSYLAGRGDSSALKILIQNLFTKYQRKICRVQMECFFSVRKLPQNFSWTHAIMW